MAYMGFNALKNKLAGEKGVTNPGGLAAYIGRKKYGAGAMASAAKSGKSLRRHAILSSMKGAEDRNAMNEV